MKCLRVTVMLFALLSTGSYADEQKLSTGASESVPSWQPPTEGIVRDGKAAITIAHAVWVSSHPEIANRIDSEAEWQKEMVATLRGGIWEIVEKLPPGTVGGGAVVLIAKSDGRVIDMYLTQ